MRSAAMIAGTSFIAIAAGTASFSIASAIGSGGDESSLDGDGIAYIAEYPDLCGFFLTRTDELIADVGLPAVVPDDVAATATGLECYSENVRGSILVIFNNHESVPLAALTNNRDYLAQVVADGILGAGNGYAIPLTLDAESAVQGPLVSDVVATLLRSVEEEGATP